MAPLLVRFPLCCRTHNVLIGRPTSRCYATVQRIRNPAIRADHHLSAPDRVYARYKPRLESRTKELGLATLDQLREAHRHRIEELRHRDHVPSATIEHGHNAVVQSAGPPPPPPQPATQLAQNTNLKKLTAYLDVEKTRVLGRPEIEAVWRLRHAALKSSLCATIPSSTFSRISETARDHPRFILPLPATAETDSSAAITRHPGDAVTLHYVEWAFPAPEIATVVMTHLEEFKMLGEFAIPHTTATLHLELAKSNDVVLLQGHVEENRGIDVGEARLLMMLLQKFYGGDVAASETERSHRLLRKFTAGSEEFSVGALVEEAERIG